MAADSIIVKRAPGLDRDERLAVRADADVKLTDMLTLPDTEVVVPRDGDVEDALAALNDNPDVVYAEPDVPVRLQSNNPMFGSLYGLKSTGQTVSGIRASPADIDAPEAWLWTRGPAPSWPSSTPVSRLSAPGPCRGPRGNPGESAGGKENNGIDDDATAASTTGSAGTSCTATARSTPTATSTGPMSPEDPATVDNGIGVAGVAPTAQVVPIKIFAGPVWQRRAA